MFRYLFLPTDAPISVPKEMTRFKCLILIERTVDNDYRNDISAALVSAGCLYALAWGLDCTLWDDSVDWAFLEHYDYGAYPEDAFVMTTWHENETLEDTLAFAKQCTTGSGRELSDILVLDFATRERGDEIEALYMSL